MDSSRDDGAKIDQPPDEDELWAMDELFLGYLEPQGEGRWVEIAASLEALPASHATKRRALDLFIQHEGGTHFLPLIYPWLSQPLQENILSRLDAASAGSALASSQSPEAGARVFWAHVSQTSPSRAAEIVFALPTTPDVKVLMDNIASHAPAKSHAVFTEILLALPLPSQAKLLNIVDPAIATVTFRKLDHKTKQAVVPLLTIAATKALLLPSDLLHVPAERRRDVTIAVAKRLRDETAAGPQQRPPAQGINAGPLVKLPPPVASPAPKAKPQGTAGILSGTPVKTPQPLPTSPPPSKEVEDVPAQDPSKLPATPIRPHPQTQPPARLDAGKKVVPSAPATTTHVESPVPKISPSSPVPHPSPPAGPSPRPPPLIKPRRKLGPTAAPASKQRRQAVEDDEDEVPLARLVPKPKDVAPKAKVNPKVEMEVEEEGDELRVITKREEVFGLDAEDARLIEGWEDINPQTYCPPDEVARVIKALQSNKKARHRLVGNNSAATAPVVFPWMREARGGGFNPHCPAMMLLTMTTLDDLTEHKKDIARFLRIPQPARNIIGGKPCRTDSALDFEIRTFLAPFLMQYIKIKRGMEPKQKTLWHQQWIPLMVQRFKDTDPNHPERNIPEADQPKYYEIYKNWMSRTAGRIEDAEKAEQERRGAVTGDNPFKASKSAIEHDQRLMAGLLRKTAVHHVWGQSPEGEAIVEPIIESLEQQHAATHKGEDAKALWSNMVVNIRNKTRAEEFAKRPPAEQARWKTIANTKGKETATLVDTAFPVQAGIVNRIADEVGAISVILSAVKRPNGKVVMMSAEYGPHKLKKAFLVEDEYGALVRGRFKAFAAHMFSAKPTAIDDIDFPEPELNMFQAPIDLTVDDRASSPKRVVPYPPKMSAASIAAADERVAKHLEKWFLEVFGALGLRKDDWRYIVKHWDEYIIEDTLPVDPQGRQVPFRQPTDWVKKELSIWANHVVGSFDGSIPVEKCLMFFGEGVRASAPSLKAEEPDLASRKKPSETGKVVKGKAKGRKRRRVESEEEEEEAVESDAGESINLDVVADEEAEDETRKLRGRTVGGHLAPRGTFDDSDAEEDVYADKPLIIPPQRRGTKSLPASRSADRSQNRDGSVNTSSLSTRPPNFDIWVPYFDTTGSNLKRTSGKSAPVKTPVLDHRGMPMPTQGPFVPPKFGPLEPPSPQPKTQYEVQCDEATANMAEVEKASKAMEVDANDVFGPAAAEPPKSPSPPAGHDSMDFDGSLPIIPWRLSHPEFMDDPEVNEIAPEYDPRATFLQMKRFVRNIRRRWPVRGIPEGAGYAPNSALPIPPIHRSLSALFVLRVGLNDSGANGSVVRFSPFDVVGNLPKHHPLSLVLQGLTKPTKSLPDAIQIQQDAWGGMPAVWKTYVAILEATVKRNLSLFQSTDTIINGSLSIWCLARTFGMWASTAYLQDGCRPGRVQREASRLGKLLSMRLGAVTAVRHMSTCYMRTVEYHIADAKDEGGATHAAWTACGELFLLVHESCAISIAAGRLDLFAHGQFSSLFEPDVVDWLSAITLDNIWEPGMRPCPKPVELHTNDFLNYVSYAATLKTVTLPQWKKFTFTDRLIAVTSAIFGLIQLETTASTTTTTRRGPRRAMDPMFKTLADGFVTLSKVVQESNRRYTADEDGPKQLIVVPDHRWEMELNNRGVLTPVPRQASGEVMERNVVPKAGDELPTIVEEADGDAVPETDAQLPTVVEDAEAPDGDGEASDDSVEQALAKLEESRKRPEKRRPKPKVATTPVVEEEDPFDALVDEIDLAAPPKKKRKVGLRTALVDDWGLPPTVGEPPSTDDWDVAANGARKPASNGGPSSSTRGAAQRLLSSPAAPKPPSKGRGAATGRGRTPSVKVVRPRAVSRASSMRPRSRSQTAVPGSPAPQPEAAVGDAEGVPAAEVAPAAEAEVAGEALQGHVDVDMADAEDAAAVSAAVPGEPEPAAEPTTPAAPGAAGPSSPLSSPPSPQSSPRHSDRRKKESRHLSDPNNAATPILPRKKAPQPEPEDEGSPTEDENSTESEDDL